MADGRSTAVPIPEYPEGAGERERVLREGELVVQGRMPWSSNGTFLVHACLPEVGEVLGVYKPEAGERPLWDFPSGLWRREVAAYEVAEALGWALVPPTVRRDDGPLGVGSVQLFVAVGPRRALLHALRRPRQPRHAAAPGHLRRRGQQHRPQGRPRRARHRRPDLGHRQRAQLPRGVQAAHGDLGVRRRPARRRGGRGAGAAARAARRRACRPWPTCSTTTSSTPWPPAPGPWPPTAACPSTRPAAATPGPWCSPVQPAAGGEVAPRSIVSATRS